MGSWRATTAKKQIVQFRSVLSCSSYTRLPTDCVRINGKDGLVLSTRYVGVCIAFDPWSNPRGCQCVPHGQVIHSPECIFGSTMPLVVAHLPPDHRRFLRLLRVFLSPLRVTIPLVVQLELRTAISHSSWHPSFASVSSSPLSLQDGNLSIKPPSLPIGRLTPSEGPHDALYHTEAGLSAHLARPLTPSFFPTPREIPRRL